MTPATAAKHTILRAYLNAWFPIMGRKPRIVVIDGFAGPGRYTGGEPGSPLIMLTALLDHSAFDRMTAEVVFLLVEQDPRREEALREEIGALTFPERVKVETVGGQFHEVMEGTLDDIRSRGADLAPTFAFIDPFGYVDTMLDLGGQILGYPSCEVLVYVPLPHIARFLDAPNVPAAALTRLFGDDRWRGAQGLGGGRAGEQALNDLLIERLEENCDYARSFQIIGAGPNTGARLFFGTSDRLGLTKMKDAMWKADPGGGVRFRDTTARDQEALFQPSPEFRLLEAMLRREFGTRPFSIEEAEDFTLLSTPFRHNGHLKRFTLGVAEREARLEVLSAPEKRSRGQYPPLTRLRFSEP
jgi:three-Cys-motif partner protein